MSTQPSRVARLAFGPYEFDSRQGELRKHGNRIRLQGQPLQILELLIGRGGEVVGRDELQRLLWPGMQSGDFEQGINAAVNKLRQALNDSADQPRYVETVPGRGYRFIAPISTSGPRAVLEMPPPNPQAPWRLNRNWIFAVAVAAAVLSAGYALGRREMKPAALTPTQFTIHPPRGFYLQAASINQTLAISPNGERLAFVAYDTNGMPHGFVRELRSLEAKQIADGAPALSLFWAPDSNSVVFSSGRNLRRADVNGTASQSIGAALPYMLSAAFVEPGKLMVSNWARAEMVPADGGQPSDLDRAYPWGQVLPGGESVLYTAFDPAIGRHVARLVKWGASAEPRRVVEADSKVLYTQSLHHSHAYLLYLREGSLVAHPVHPKTLESVAQPVAIASKISSFRGRGSAGFSVSERGVLTLQRPVERSQWIWVDRKGNRLAAATPVGQPSVYARISPNGKIIATVQHIAERGRPDIWLYDSPSAPGRRFDPGAEDNNVPVWSPDSTTLAFMRPVSPAFPTLNVRAIAAEAQSFSLPSGSMMMPTSWSPDGRFILTQNSGLPRFLSEGQADVFAFDTISKKQFPLIQSKFSEWGAVFSPDGKWIAFLSNESGRQEMYLQAVELSPELRLRGSRQLVSKRGAQSILWRADGAEIYYLSSDGLVYAMPIRLGKKVEAGQPVALFPIDAAARTAVHSVVAFDVTRDGSRFLIPSVDEGQDAPSIVVVQDWESVLLPR